MIIKFSVLWMEDDDSYFNATKRNLTSYLKKLGFYLDVDRIKDPINEDIHPYLENTSKYDLMLIDWRVKAKGAVDKPIGGEIISQIRKRIAYSEILFYSGSDGIAKELAKRKMEGVYLAHRTRMREDAKELIEFLLRKTLHPKTMRGIVVSALSQVDDLCFQVIKLKYQAEVTNKKEMAASLKRSLLKKSRKRQKDYEKICQMEDDKFISSLHSTLVMDSFKRAEKTLAFAELDKLSEDILGPLKELPQTVTKRNKLAHWKRSEETNDHIRLSEHGKEDFLFDQKEAIKIRNSINNAADALNKYISKIN